MDFDGEDSPSTRSAATLASSESKLNLLLFEADGAGDATPPGSPASVNGPDPHVEPLTEFRRARARALWRRAARMAREQLFAMDPLAHVELGVPEKVVRRRWIGGKWAEDIATIRMSQTPFAEGSLRTCYHAKKMSSRCTLRHVQQHSKHAQWAYQRNYVLKVYKSSSCRGGGQRMRSMLEGDVRTQAEAKALGDQYNKELRGLLKAGRFDRRSPQPMKFKCVDMLEATLVTFVDRPNKPTYFMEAYVAGHFSKYNGNAGYVASSRATPQALSHFTFCRTRGEKIVVDVQGVGDLLTDPVLHTRAGNRGPGDGGMRGFGLFFATHKCNRICRRMGLPRFRTSTDHDGGSDTEVDDQVTEAGYDAPLSILQRHLDAEPLEGATGLTQADALGCVLPDCVVDALPAKPAPSLPGSAAWLMKEPHRELGKMLLDDDDGLTRARPEAALYHLSAAALGGDAVALEFLRDVRLSRDRRRVQAEAAARASALRACAAVAIFAAALYNVSALLARRRRW